MISSALEIETIEPRSTNTNEDNNIFNFLKLCIMTNIDSKLSLNDFQAF